MDFAPPPSWRRRVTGRWAISWQAQALGSILVLVLIPLGGSAIGATRVDPAETGAWFLATAVAVVAINAYVYLIHLTGFRHRAEHPVALPLVLLFHLGLGVIFGLVLGLMVQALGLTDALTPIGLAAGFGVGAILWCTSVSNLLASDEEFHVERDELLDAAVDLEVLSISEARLASRLRAILDRADVGGRAADQMRALPMPTASLLPLDEWWGISASLRNSQDPRTLTDKLREAADRRYPDVGIGTIIRGSLFRQGFAALPVGLIVAVIYLPDATYRMGVFGPAASLALGVVVAVTLWLASRASARWQHLATVWFTVGFVLVQLETIAFLRGFPGPSSTTQPLPWTEILASFLLVTMVLIVTSGTRALARDRAQLLEIFRADTHEQRRWQADYLTTLSALTLEAAEQVHKPLRTNLAMAAAGIAAAALPAVDGQVSTDTMLTLINNVDSSLDDNTPETTTLADLLDGIRAPWEGLVEIDIDLPTPMATWAGATPTLISRVAEEAVANAARHGLADEIHISVKPDSEESSILHVTVVDNGIGLQGGQPGLGTALFSEASANQFTLSRRKDGGCELNVTLHMNQAAP